MLPEPSGKTFSEFMKTELSISKKKQKGRHVVPKSLQGFTSDASVSNSGPEAQENIQCEKIDTRLNTVFLPQSASEKTTDVLYYAHAP